MGWLFEKIQIEIIKTLNDPMLSHNAASDTHGDLGAYARGRRFEAERIRNAIDLEIAKRMAK